MYYRRSGYPQENEILLCQVTKIFPNSVFVEILEYGERGMVHISEVSPGRIRNLRDYVSEGRQIICKVLRIDREKGHIDLSLRRVNAHQRQEKLDQIKSELKSEAIVKNLAKQLKRKPEVLYKAISKPIFKEYSHLYLAFRDAANGELSFDELGIEKKVWEPLLTAIEEKFKPQSITIQGELRVRSYESDGALQVRDLLKAIGDVSDTITLFYLGGGRWKLVIEDLDYKPAEAHLKEALGLVEGFTTKQNTASFERERGD